MRSVVRSNGRPNVTLALEFCYESRKMLPRDRGDARMQLKTSWRAAYDIAVSRLVLILVKEGQNMLNHTRAGVIGPFDLNGDVAPVHLDDPVDLRTVRVAPKAELGRRMRKAKMTDQLESDELLE